MKSKTIFIIIKNPRALLALFTLSISQVEWGFPEATRHVISQKLNAEVAMRI